nr:EAL domain-containing protein [uncultured Cohaesibacter sp.]
MKELFRRSQLFSVFLIVSSVTFLDEVILAEFIQPDELEETSLLFKGFAQYLLLIALSFGVLLMFGYINSRKQTKILMQERDKSRKLAAQLRSHKLGIDAHAIVSITTPQGKITYANESFCKISQYSLSELIGQDHRLLSSRVHDVSFFNSIYKTIENGKPWSGEICNRAKDGSLFWVATTIMPIISAAGKLEEVIAIRTDITDMKRKESELKSSSDLLNSTFENFPGGISVFDADKNLVLANKAYYELQGNSPEAFPIGSNLADLLRKNVRNGLYGEVDEDSFIEDSFKMLDRGQPNQFLITAASGRVVELKSWPLEDGSIVLAHYDVTERHNMLKDLTRKNEEAKASAEKLLAAQKAEEEAHKRLINSINSMSGGFALWDSNARLVIANASFIEHHKEISDLIHPGVPARELLEAGHKVNLWNWKRFESNKRVDIFYEMFTSDEDFSESVETSDGHYLNLYCTKLPNGDITTNFIDATEDRRREAELLRARDALAHIAYYDALTTLPNRAKGQQDLETLFENKKSGERFAIIQIDLDKFKRVNDTLGHGCGDHLLQEIGNRLAFLSSKVTNFQPYRWGGDEFVAIVTDVHNDQLESLCQELTDLIAIPVQCEGSTIWPTVSLGVSIYPDDAKDFPSLMMYADLALYKTKEMGRDGYQFFSAEMKEKLDSEASLESDIRSALKNDEFEMHFQPQISTLDESITGIEALVRWNHPHRGQLPPAMFMDIIESNGMAATLGNIIFEKAMWAARQWIDEGLSFGRLSVNLSPAHLKRKTLVDDFCHNMEKYQINPNMLAVELLEGVLLDDAYSNINELFEILSAKGVHVELDDFGTGYASLSHLSNLPIDGIKIDRSFVNNIVVNKKQKAIVGVVMSMSKLMQLRVVCEGIETHQQLSTVSQIANCSVQGYLVSRPLSFTDMTKWIREERNIGQLSPAGPRQVRKEHTSIASNAVNTK